MWGLRPLILTASWPLQQVGWDSHAGLWDQGCAFKVVHSSPLLPCSAYWTNWASGHRSCYSSLCLNLTPPSRRAPGRHDVGWNGSNASSRIFVNVQRSQKIAHLTPPASWSWKSSSKLGAQSTRSQGGPKNLPSCQRQ